MARKKQKLKLLNKLWMRYEYKHTTLALLSIWLFTLLIDSALVAAIFTYIERLGYVGGFIAGVLSVSFFTAAPAIILLVDLSNKVDAHVLALAWALGSTIGDWIVVRFYQERVFHELAPVFRKLGMGALVKAMRHKYTAWMLFLAGAVVIASPLPDEAGIGLMGLSHLKRPYIIFMCFLLNLLGALVVILAVEAVSA
jgi:membrane protein YqaA with SNARE-associated domain